MGRWRISKSCDSTHNNGRLRSFCGAIQQIFERRDFPPGESATKRVPFKRQTTADIYTTKYQWSDLIPNVFAECNNKNKHHTTGMTPAEAKKPSSEVDAKTAMELVARRGRQFQILHIVYIVKVLRKYKAVGDKEFMDQFQRGEHTVESISENVGQKFYKLSDGK